MVVCNAVGQCGGKVCKVRWRIAIGVQLLRPREGGVQQALVAHAGNAAVLGELA